MEPDDCPCRLGKVTEQKEKKPIIDWERKSL